MSNTKLIFTVGFFFFITIHILNAQNSVSSHSFLYQNEYYYLTNRCGKVNEKIEPFTYADSFSEGVALVSESLLFGYIDTTGSKVIDCLFYDAGSFNGGLAYASLEDKYGYINYKGEFVIDPSFDLACDFNGKYARVVMRNSDFDKYGLVRWLEGIINTSGTLISDKYFESITFKEHGVINGVVNDSIFVLSQDGEFVFEKVKVYTNGKGETIMPHFYGGDSAMGAFINRNVRYPPSAKAYGISGKCFVKFVIDEKGNVTDVMPSDISHPILLKESMRVIKTMPQWVPGITNNKKMRVSFTVPINYR